MDYRTEIIKLLNDITDEDVLVYLCTFLRLHLDYGPTGGQA